MTAALEGCEWSAARPGRTLSPGKTRYPFYRRLGGPQGRSGRAENLIPTGIRSRTVQSVVGHYTYWATGPRKLVREYIMLMQHLHYNIGWSYRIGRKMALSRVTCVHVLHSYWGYSKNIFKKKVIRHFNCICCLLFLIRRYEFFREIRSAFLCYRIIMNIFYFENKVFNKPSLNFSPFMKTEILLPFISLKHILLHSHWDCKIHHGSTNFYEILRATLEF